VTAAAIAYISALRFVLFGTEEAKVSLGAGIAINLALVGVHNG